jgi:hypothetical protein
MITKDDIEDRLEEGKTCAAIAEEFEVTPGYISQLCKKYGIKPPRPGRKAGTELPYETKEKISQTIRKRIEGGL